MKISSYDVPFDADKTREVIELLSDIFGSDEVRTELPTLSGEENEYNRDIQYIAEEDGKLLGASHVTVTRAMPGIGGLSGVCTALPARNKGIGRTLVERCVADFEAAGGEVLFLGTDGTVSAKLYSSAGFSFLPGSNVMVRVSNGSYIDFVKKHFSGAEGQLEITCGSPAFRYLLVPLVLYRGNNLILDCNAGLFNSSYVTQRSCAGLYPRYAEIAEKGGSFAGAFSAAGALCAVASILPASDGNRMDFFAHPDAEHILPDLIRWGEEYGAQYTLVSDADTGKFSLLKSLGYREEGRQTYKSGPISVDCAVMRK